MFCKKYSLFLVDYGSPLYTYSTCAVKKYYKFSLPFISFDFLNNSIKNRLSIYETKPGKNVRKIFCHSFFL